MAAVLKDFREATTYDILAWHRPVVSGVTLAALFTVWFIFVYYEYTLVTYVSRIVEIAFILGAVATLTQKAFVSSADVKNHMDHMYEKIRPYAMRFVEGLFGLLTWSNPVASAKVFLASFLVAYVGNWFSDSTLLLILLILAFSVPVVYEKEKPVIDAYLKKAEDFVDKYLNMLKTKGTELKSKVEGSDAAKKLHEMEEKKK